MYVHMYVCICTFIHMCVYMCSACMYIYIHTHMGHGMDKDLSEARTT